MKVNKETIGTVVVVVLLLGVLSYKNWTKSQKIQELESVIQVHKMYSTQEQLRNNYNREKVLRTSQFRTINDSLKISFTATDLATENSRTHINFGVTAISKLDKEIKYINGTLTLSDSFKIIVAFPLEITPEFLPDTDTTYWSQSWNLERYTPALTEILKSHDIKLLKTEWRTNTILFTDNSAIVLNENSD